jgi:hypothetical protein
LHRLIHAVAAMAASALVISPAHAGHAFAPARVTVDINTSGAAAVLAAATADSTHAAPAADAALENDAVRAMIAKMAQYDHTVTPESFKAAVIALAHGGSEGPFDLARLRSDPDATRRMLARLTAEHDAISRRLADRLQSFTPDNLDLHATLFVLVGAKHQNGWVPDNRPNFYVDLGFHGEEMESVTNSAAHELFHVVQVTVQPIGASELTDQPDLPVDARELHRAHAIVLNLVIEGMATYVGDPTTYVANGPRLTHDQNELKKELARASDIFALFDTILFRARHDPDAPLDPLLRIGFGGSWDETGYFVGYRMAKTIDRYAGRDRLRTLVTLPPQAFVGQYIAIAQAHPDDPEITPLAPASIATVKELQKLQASQ